MTLPNPLFEESYGRLFGPGVAAGGEADRFFLTFYDHFLRDPEIAKLFTETDMDQQVQMLKRSLFQVVSFYISGEPSAELQRIAEVHKGLGVESSMFDAWLEALVETVAEYDVRADEATRLAWCWALTPGMTYIRMVILGLGRTG